jgi:hypothetical protein
MSSTVTDEMRKALADYQGEVKRVPRGQTILAKMDHAWPFQMC